MSAFGYFGSKKRITPQLVALLPPHSSWVELFCGSAAVTLAKPRAPDEVLNDTNADVVNFYTQLVHNKKALLQHLDLTPYAREEFELAISDADPGNPLEKARRFYVRSMMSINGAGGANPGGFSYTNAFSRDGREGRVNRWLNAVAQLDGVARRLQTARIECRDALDLFSEFSSQVNTLVYFDPPYLGERAASYDCDIREESFHVRMLTDAMRARCMVLISGYENDLYADLLTPADGWHKVAIVAETRGSNGKSHARREVVWMNSWMHEARQRGPGTGKASPCAQQARAAA
jgi:DNA adenine methylase